jgi:cyclic beta-1,2-glucan synthetase
VKPCIPDDWPGFSAAINIEKSYIDITVDNAVPLSNNKLLAQLNGVALESLEQDVRVRLEGGHHRLTISAKAILNT